MAESEAPRISPHLDNNCTGKIYLINCFGTLDSDEGLQLPEDLDSVFWLISVLAQQAATHVPPLAMWQAAMYVLVLAAACTQLVGAKRSLFS